MKNSNGQVADGSKVHPRRDDNSAIVAPDRSRGLGHLHLAALVEAWPDLPVALKADILAMVKAAAK